MIGAFTQDQTGALARGKNVLLQIAAVDFGPQLAGDSHRLLFGKLGIMVKIGVGIGKRALTEFQETIDIPALQ